MQRRPTRKYVNTNKKYGRTKKENDSVSLNTQIEMEAFFVALVAISPREAKRQKTVSAIQRIDTTTA